MKWLLIGSELKTEFLERTLYHLTIKWRFNRLIRFLNYYISSSLIHGFSSLNSCLFIFVCLSSIVRVCLRGAPHLTSPLPFIHFSLHSHSHAIEDSLHFYWGLTLALLGTDSYAIGDWLHFYWGCTLTLLGTDSCPIVYELMLCPKGGLFCFQLKGILGKNLAEWWKSCNFAAWIFENRRKITINQWN